METPNYYAILPANVRYDKELSPSEKLLYAEITALSQSNGYCYATNSYLATLYGVTKKTVSAWVNNLIKKGYLDSTVTYKNDGKGIDQRLLTPIPKKKDTPPEKKGYPPPKKKDTPIPKNVKENNTRDEYYKINNKKIYKKDLAEQAKEDEKVKSLLKQLEVSDGYVEGYIKYRKEISKALKTIRPIIDFLKNLLKIKEAGIELKEAIEMMKSNEWQTVTLEYMQNKMRASNGNRGVASSNQQAYQDLMKRRGNV